MGSVFRLLAISQPKTLVEVQIQTMEEWHVTARTSTLTSIKLHHMPELCKAEVKTPIQHEVWLSTGEHRLQAEVLLAQTILLQAFHHPVTWPSPRNSCTISTSSDSSQVRPQVISTRHQTKMYKGRQ